MTRRTPLHAILCVALLPLGHGVSFGRTGDSSVPVIEARLTDVKLRSLLDGENFALPQLRVYDRDGRLLREFTSYNPTNFESELSQLVSNPVASPKNEPTISGELAVIVTGEGKPLGELAKVDLTFVEYWAEWCAPCHLQFDALVKFLESHSEVHARLLHVEADPSKLEGVEIRVLPPDSPKP